MSLYDNASLVMIPSGVKEDKLYSVKPTDGTGDFTFSRGSDIQATRVNSSGLIEKAKVNLLTYSNDFSNAAWVKTGVTPTSGQAGYDGTNDAWLMSSTNTTGEAYQLSTNGVSTISLRVKAGNTNWIAFRILASNGTAWFNLSTGAFATIQSAIIDTNVESLSGGWYEISVTAATSGFLAIYIANGDNTFVSTSGNSIYIQDAQLNHGLIAQDYVETTTTAVVEGLTADLPRLDYSGGASCPSLLLEPSRTNILANSEYFGSTPYSRINSTITSNATTSPEGIVNATKVESTSAASAARLEVLPSLTDNTIYTNSAFVKAGNVDWCFLGIRTKSGITTNVFFNIANGTKGTEVNSPIDADIEDYGNGWYRVYVTQNISSGGTAPRFQFGVVNTDNVYTSSVGDYIYYFGLQSEAGSYPTSYIPTYGTAANRAFEYPQVNPQTMLGATEGSWFVNFDDMAFDISGTSSPSLYLGYNLSNFVGIANRSSGNVYNVQFIKRESGAITNIHTLTPQVGNDKFCFTWNGSNLKLFVNGVKVYDDNGFANYPAWDDFSIGYSTRVPRYNNKQTLLFPTQLTDAEAIALTTI